ncbi:MAG: hypothetical protein K8J31_31120 [Anaerolineae bacterium]|nr:hypothetical protein [Anaerolineae bacterium]
MNTGIAFVAFDEQTIDFNDFVNALIVDESNSLFNSTGFYISPDGQFVVYDAIFDAEKELFSRRGLALVDVSSEREV